MKSEGWYRLRVKSLRSRSWISSMRSPCIAGVRSGFRCRCRPSASNGCRLPPLKARRSLAVETPVALEARRAAESLTTSYLGHRLQLHLLAKGYCSSQQSHVDGWQSRAEVMLPVMMAYCRGFRSLPTWCCRPPYVYVIQSWPGTPSSHGQSGCNTR